MNVDEEQALLLPGRVPGFKRIDVKLLPSSLTKFKLWKHIRLSLLENQLWFFLFLFIKSCLRSVIVLE